MQVSELDVNPALAAYNHATHLKERRALMDAWANHLDRLRRGAEVYEFPQRAA